MNRSFVFVLLARDAKKLMAGKLISVSRAGIRIGEEWVTAYMQMTPFPFAPHRYICVEDVDPNEEFFSLFGERGRLLYGCDGMRFKQSEYRLVVGERQ